ncbi:MAG: YfhO family protein, partial [Acidimicrobiia bacterium]
MRQLAGVFSGRRPWAPVVAPLVVFSEALTGRRTLVPGDGFSTYLPWFSHAAQAWKAAEIPGWNAYSFAGSPLLAISQAGVYYPPNWLFVVLPPVPAVNLVIVIQFVIAGLGAWLLTRHLTGDTTAAAVAGVAFALCGFMFAHIGHASMIASAAWLPWVLYGYERLRLRFRPANLAIASGALALSFLAGHSQLACTAVVVVGLYALGVRGFVPRSERGRPLLAAAALLVVAGGLSAAQLIPTLRYVGFSDRADLSYAQAMEYSFPGSHAPLVLFPYLFGNQSPDGPFASPYHGRFNLTELSGYPGMAALVLAGAGLGLARRDRRLMALAAAGVVAGALALGSETPLSRLVFHLPIYGQFRSWGRYVVVLDLVVAVFAGYGVAHLRASARRRGVLWGAGATAAGVALAAVVLPRLGPIE